MPRKFGKGIIGKPILSFRNSHFSPAHFHLRHKKTSSTQRKTSTISPSLPFKSRPVIREPSEKDNLPSEECTVSSTTVNKETETCRLGEIRSMILTYMDKKCRTVLDIETAEVITTNVTRVELMDTIEFYHEKKYWDYNYSEGRITLPY